MNSDFTARVPDQPVKADPSPPEDKMRSTAGPDDDDDDTRGGRERRKIEIKFIQDKGRRHITFSKRRHGIMKKAWELSMLTGTQVLLLVVSETGLVYTYSTPKLQPMVTQPEGKRLIQDCLNAPDPLPLQDDEKDGRTPTQSSAQAAATAAGTQQAAGQSQPGQATPGQPTPQPHAAQGGVPAPVQRVGMPMMPTSPMPAAPYMAHLDQTGAPMMPTDQMPLAPEGYIATEYGYIPASQAQAPPARYPM